jgi:hypothetical protein
MARSRNLPLLDTTHSGTTHSDASNSPHDVVPAGPHFRWPAPRRAFVRPSDISPATPPEATELGLSRRIALRWCVALISLGLVVRLVRYALRFPLWHDELMLVANLLDRDYEALLVPLSLKQVAPFGFLWIERFLIENWGFHEWSLRLFPTLCGSAGLIVFGLLAWRSFAVTHANERDHQIDRLAAVLAIGVLSVAYYPLRHACEVKPYAVDLCVGALLPWLAVEWLRRPGRTGWLWGLALATPLAMWVSYPTAFVAGGTAIALLPAVWKSQRASVLAAYGSFGVLMLAGFFVVTGMGGSAGHQDLNADMSRIWSHTFPPMNNPLSFASWVVSVHTGEFLAYPVGSENGGSLLSTILAGVGIWWLWRRSHSVVARPLLLATFATLGLLFVASVLHKYPYGGHPRLVQFLAPHLSLLVGTGAAVVIGHLRHARHMRTATIGALSVLCLLGGITLARDVVHPFKSRADARHTAFAKDFWSRPDPAGWTTLCLTSNRTQTFHPTLCDFSYRIHRAIYSPRQPEQFHLGVPVEHRYNAVRVVLFRNLEGPVWYWTWDWWIHNMRLTHTLVRTDEHPIHVMSDASPDYYLVMWFVPNLVTNPPKVPEKAVY